MKIATSLGQVSFEQTGEGPDIVLLHSLLSDRNVFHRIVPALRTSRRVTLVDLPGFGESDLVGAGISGYADVIGELIRDQHMDPSTTALLGNGLGGFVALGTAVRHGDLFNGLILAGAGAYFPGDAATPLRIMIEKVQSDGMKAIIEIAVRRIFTEQYLEANPDEGDERRDVLRSNDPAAFVDACGSLVGLDYRTEAGLIANPTLLVVGSADAATPPAMAEDLASRIPDAELVILEGLAHAPQLQAPERFLAVLEPFLSRTMGEE